MVELQNILKYVLAPAPNPIHRRKLSPVLSYQHFTKIVILGLSSVFIYNRISNMRLRNKTCILDVKIMKCIFMRNVQSSYSSENIKPEA